MDFGMNPPPEPTGSTMRAVEFDGGVVMGADSRSSCGNYVANRISDKLTYTAAAVDRLLTPKHWEIYVVPFILNLQEMTTGKVPLVIHAAHHFRTMGYKYRGSVTAGIIEGDWDAKDGGRVFSIPDTP